MPKIAAVLGPTASGKTALAIRIAERFGGEIVSADSRQIYRGMDIGTAKPTAAERRAVPHHLIDIRNPDEDYTVADFKRDATATIGDILGRDKLPILAGGTGLYAAAVLHNWDIPKVEADPGLRHKLEKEMSDRGLPAMFEKLVELDPEAAYVVDPKNPRRIIRALEVTLANGIPFTAQRKKGQPLYEALTIGLAPEGTILRKRIDARVDEMMSQGLIDEVRSLVRRYGTACPALDAIGYREIIAHLEGRATLAETAARMKLNTWHYAKRQMTWFKKDPSIRWFPDSTEAFRFAEQELRKVA